MNDLIQKAIICIGGFLGMFMPLFLFADPGVSPFYSDIYIPEKTVVMAAVPEDAYRFDDLEFPVEGLEIDASESASTGVSVSENAASESASTEGTVSDHTASQDASSKAGNTTASDGGTAAAGDGVSATSGSSGIATRGGSTKNKASATYRLEPQSSFQLSDDLKMILDEAVGENSYEVRAEKGTLIIAAWEDGLSGVIKKDIFGSLQSHSQWVDAQSEYIKLYDTVKRMTEEGRSYKHLEIDVVDENDHTRQFMRIADGEVLSEIVGDTRRNQIAASQNTTDSSSASDSSGASSSTSSSASNSASSSAL